MQTQKIKIALICGLLIAVLLVQKLQVDGAFFLNYILLSLLIISLASLTNEQKVARVQQNEKSEMDTLKEKLSRK